MLRGRETIAEHSANKKTPESWGKVDYNKIQDNKGNTYYTPYHGTYNNGTFIMIGELFRKNQFMILQ